MGLKEQTIAVEPELIELRRYFHRHAERSWEEKQTQQKIKEYLDAEGIPYIEVCRTGVVATIKGPHSSKHTIGIRADMDALPVTEETGCDYASENPCVMHACGHDAHVAVLLATAKLLNEQKENLKVTVRLIFQPAEESIEDSGAYYMKTVSEVLECDRLIGLHIWGSLEAGYASLVEGPIMASADTFDIEIVGRGGHGAHPELAIDPIAAGVALCGEFQRIIAREIGGLEPAVISVTSFNAGTTSNVIPEKAHLSGTARAFSEDTRRQFPEAMERVEKGIAAATRTDISVDYHWGPPVTINDPEVTATGRKAANAVFGADHLITLPPQMGGEDFAKYTNRKAFLMLGGGNKDPKLRFNQHNPRFNIDESALKLGVEYFLRYIEEWEEEIDHELDPSGTFDKNI